MTHLTCPYCPAQAYPERHQGVIVEYFVSSEGPVAKYICPAKHEFYVEVPSVESVL